MDYSRVKLIKEALFQRCHWSDKAFIFRYLYTVKIILCILLGLFQCPLERNSVVKGVARFDFKSVSWHPDPNIFLWSELAVGASLFHNWFFEVYQDTTPDSNVLKEGDQRVIHISLSKLQDLS